jgi:hypothetical protein
MVKMEEIGAVLSLTEAEVFPVGYFHLMFEPLLGTFSGS